jgi:hypothetical protein
MKQQPHRYNVIDKIKKSSIFLKVQELFHEKLKIKITPVPLDPFSKVPAVKGWTDSDYDPNIFSWSRHPGNIGIIPGRSNLLVIDCDTQESIQFFEKLANKINLTLDTLIVKTRRGAHYYYLCNFSLDLEKKQFTNPDRNIKIDCLAGTKCQVVAPYSMLKINQDGNVLKPDAKDYILFIYEPINIPNELPEISRDKYNTLILELEKYFQKSKEKSTTIILTHTEQEQERELTDEEINKIAEIVAEYFQEGQRQNLLLYLSGFLRKELNIAENSIYKIYEELQPADDPSDVKARFAAIKKTFEKPLDQITGRTGLAEVLGEDIANELCTKIKKALGIEKIKEKEPLSDEFLEQLLEEMQTRPKADTPEEQYIYIEISKKNRKFARCNYNDLTTDYGVMKRDEETNALIFELHSKVFLCCIKNVYSVENPLTGEKKYEVHFISHNPEEPYTILKGTLREIWEALNQKTSYVFLNSIGLQILTAVVDYYLKQGWYQKKQEDLPDGFYFLDGKLHAQGFEEKPYTKEDLQRGAIFLNEYIYSHPNPQLISNIIKAGLLLPFAFAQKQMVLSGKLRRRIKYLYLCGETKSGKTTTAMLLSRIWGRDYKISYASFNTEPRAAKHLSTSTFVIIVDEVSKDLETSTVKELLKYAQEDIIARTIQSKTLKQIHFPALSAVVMTSNSHFPEDPALLERFIVFRFRKSDRISTIARAKYEKEDFKKLEILGQFVWKYIQKNGLRDDYIDYATQILRAFYQEAKVQAEWLDLPFMDDTAETEEEQAYKKEAEFFNAVQNFFLHNVKKEEEPYAKSVYKALKGCVFGRWIWADDNHFLYLSKDFLLELKRSYKCQIRDLEELKELMGWEKKIKKYKNTTIYVVQTTLMDFFHRLNLIPKLVSAYEFEEWISNRLKIEPEEDLDTINEKLPF